MDVVRVEATILGWSKTSKGSAEKKVALLEPCSTSKDSNGDEALIHGALANVFAATF